MSDQDAGTATPEAAETATEDTTHVHVNLDPDAVKAATEEEAGKPRRPASDDLKSDLAKERRERQRLQNELQKLKDRDLSELERAQRQAADATKRLEQLEAESLRQRVALKAGIPAEHIHRLQGDTEDALAADAAELAKLLTPKAPRPDPSQGSRAGNRPTDMNELIRSAARRG